MERAADLVIKSEAIFTGTGAAPISGAIAMAGDRILDVGPKERIDRLVGPNTRVIEAGDRLVLPGFHDFHLHLWIGSLFLQSADLTHCLSEEDAVREVAAFAARHPEDPWVLGFGWHHMYWTDKKRPTRHSLDERIPDRPVFLLNEELHCAWLNTKALEAIGLDRDAADPRFGKIERDASGQPTGFLEETAVALAWRAVQISDAKKEKLIPEFLRKAASLGITSVSDMLPLPGYEAGDPAWYAQYEARGELTARVHFLSALDGDLERAEELRRRYHSDALRFSGLKQFIDGVPLTHTGYMLEPYADLPGEKGGTLYPKETYEQWIVEADRAGFQIRLHACGDAAVRFALDCFEKARAANGPRDARHCVEHIETIDPADLDRFRRLGVIASMQPEHLSANSVDEHPYAARLGPERIRRAWPIGSLRDHGARLVFSSDYPVVDLNPLVGIYRAATRKHYDGLPVDGWHPEERVSLADALACYTREPARGVFREHELGTLEPGKKADVVVLDRNLFAVEPEEWLEARVDWTIMNGAIVYARS